MFLFDLVGAALTLVTLAFLGLGGYAAALSPLAMSRNARPPVSRSIEARNEAITWARA